MEITDMVISPIEVEDPILYRVSVNDNLLNIAFQLKTVTLLGPSSNSSNAEYRRFSISTESAKILLNGKSNYGKDNVFKNADIAYKRIFDHLSTVSTSANKYGLNSVEIENITKHGIDYLLIYYLLTKHFNYRESHFTQMNAFILIGQSFELLDKIYIQSKFTIRPTELKYISDYLLRIKESTLPISSKIIGITKSDVLDSANLSRPIWKSMYINKILRNEVATKKTSSFSPFLDWGILRYPMDQIFTNVDILNRVKTGKSIIYIKKTSEQQHAFATCINPDIYEAELKEVKSLTKKLSLAVADINYTLSDISIILFYKHEGESLFACFNTFIDISRNANKVDQGDAIAKILVSEDGFRHFIFKYLYSVYLLASNGIIHNDPHLNNIIIHITEEKNDIKIDYPLEKNITVSMQNAGLNVSIIDFNQSILSYEHVNSFQETAESMNKILALVFGSSKKKVVDNYSQLFNCFVMYDIIKFGLILKDVLLEMENVIGDLLPKPLMQDRHEFLERMITIATEILSKIYDTTPNLPFDLSSSGSSASWLIANLYKSHIKPNRTEGSKTSTRIRTVNIDDMMFISAKRKYMDSLKYNYLAQYSGN